VAVNVLITGPRSPLGARLAERLSGRGEVAAVRAVEDPHGRQLEELIAQGRIDTVIDLGRRPGPLLAVCETSGVRKLILASSAHYYGFDPGAPAFLTEGTLRVTRARGALEREVLAAEAAVAAFAARNPERSVTILRFADELGSHEGPHHALLALPFVPAILGFDPRWQFIDAHDVVGILAHAALNEIPGVFNAAADGVLALSEVASLLGKPMLPVLPPLGLGLAVAQLARLGIRAPVELVDQLRLGRGLDNRRLKATGYAFRYTSREAVQRLAGAQGPAALLGRGRSSPGA